jgi:hypothetical protein
VAFGHKVDIANHAANGCFLAAERTFLPGKLPTVMIEELAGVGWSEVFDIKRLSLVTLSAGVWLPCGPPMSVCTQPGLTATQVIPRAFQFRDGRLDTSEVGDIKGHYTHSLVARLS